MKNNNLNYVIRKIKVTLLSAIILSALFSCSVDKEIKVVSLQCEYLENPLGIDIAASRLSWQLRTNKNNVNQKAYQILVSSDIAVLKNNIGDLWNSDTVFSDQSTQINYDGTELKSRQKVFWKVRIWDETQKVSEWSEISSWEMGLLFQSDWSAKWISKKEFPKLIVGAKSPAIYFRKKIKIKDGIKNARVYISGLGYYELYINGEKVGDHVLSPNQTNYDRRKEVNSYLNGRVANMSTRVLYETHDVSNYFKKGENVASVILGNGWYFQTLRSEYIPLYYDTPRFISQIEIEYPDGSKETIISDESWKNGKGPILNNNLHNGEIYDARLEIADWNKKNFDDSKWKKSKIVRSPEGKLHAQMSPPDRVVAKIKPVSISVPKEGVYRYDFGTMFSGWVKLKMEGKRGSELKLTYFEDNGNTYEQSDSYIFKGEGIEVWEPRFTWHAFRYVEVTGSNVPLAIDNLEGQIVHTDVKPAGSFKSSNELFNRILSDFKKTQLDNMHGGVPTDCPHRERRGYTGDGQIAAQAAIYSLDMKSFYTKWLNDISDAQNKKNGYVPNTVPFHSGGGGTPWGSAYVIIPWYMYLYYGDVAILEKHYDGMKHYVEYLSTTTDKDGLIVENHLGEWVPPTATEIPPSFVSSAYYYYDLSLMASIANVLKKESDVKNFLKIGGEVKKSFNERYYQPSKFSYSIGWQGANVFPLAFDLVPREYVENVFQSLVENIEVTAKGHFDTGMMGTPYLLEVLTKYGRTDLAYTIMNRRDFPSFGYNIERGATTLWETWTGNESHSHPMFGSVTAWFYQGLGGINPDPNNPGFKHSVIKPNIINDLDFVNATYTTVYGKITSNWELINGELKLSVTIPPNTTASVFVPGNSVDDTSIDNSNVDFIAIEDNYLHYEVPSGEYTFVSKKISEQIQTPMLSIPVIDPADSTLFSPDSVKVNIRQYSKNGEIRYTIDGSEPSKDSELFTQPFILQNSAVIKAKVFRDGESGYTKTNRIIFIDSLKNGLSYKYYVGAWIKLPNFAKLIPVSSGRVYKISLDEFPELDNKFGIVFSGEIEINNDGLYTFYLSSNDGSRLFIDDKKIINFDGLHGSAFRTENIKLSKGMHKIKLQYFQAGGGKGLELLFEGPGIEKQIVPADILIMNK